MNNQEKCNNVLRILDFVETLTDDPALQVEMLLNAQSFIQNSVTTATLRQALYNILNPKY